MHDDDTGAKASTQEARHTPGPWHVDSTDACYVRAPNGSSIATMGFLSIRFWGPRRPDAEVLANASLIAAAPDLLEALHNCMIVTNMFKGDDVAMQLAVDQAKAAIAKARGLS